MDTQVEAKTRVNDSTKCRIKKQHEKVMKQVI